MPTDAIRPRTKSERVALLVGFGMAIEMIIVHGLDRAQTELELMTDSEERTTNAG